MVCEATNLKVRDHGRARDPHSSETFANEKTIAMALVGVGRFSDTRLNKRASGDCVEVGHVGWLVGLSSGRRRRMVVVDRRRG